MDSRVQFVRMNRAIGLQLSDRFTIRDLTIEFFLPVTIVIIPDVLVTNLITKLYKSCLIVMTFQTMLAGMNFSITGTQNSHGNGFLF